MTSETGSEPKSNRDKAAAVYRLSQRASGSKKCSEAFSLRSCKTEVFITLRFQTYPPEEMFCGGFGGLFFQEDKNIYMYPLTARRSSIVYPGFCGLTSSIIVNPCIYIRK